MGLFFVKINIIKGVLGGIVKQPNGAIVPDSIVYKSFPFNLSWVNSPTLWVGFDLWCIL